MPSRSVTPIRLPLSLICITVCLCIGFGVIAGILIFPTTSTHPFALGPASSPISIVSDDDFASQASANGWIGDGTAGNPYLIQNLNILITSDQTGIAIGINEYPYAPITAFFVIQNVTIIGDSNQNQGEYGIWCINAANGIIQNCTISTVKHGCEIEGVNSEASNVNITATSITNCNIGLYYTQSGTASSVLAANNTLTENVYGIDAFDITGSNEFFNNTLITNTEGFVISECTGAVIANNTILNGQSDDILLQTSSTDIDIMNNTLQSSWTGILFDGITGNTIADNRINDTQEDIELDYCSGDTITENTLYSSAEPLVLYETSGNTITSNTIYPGLFSITTDSGTSTTGSFDLSWSASAYVTDYLVYQNGDLYATESNLVTTIAFTDLPENVYTYAVIATNTAGSVASNPNATTITVAYLPGAFDLTASTAASETGTFWINWTAAANTDNYTLDQNSDLIAAGLTNTSYSFTGMSDGSYTYTVTANAEGGSTDSTPASVTIVVQTTPTAFTLYATPGVSTTGDFVISWSTPTFFDNYSVWQNSVLWASDVTNNSLDFTDTANGQYTYSVVAYSVGGSTDSDPTSITVTVQAPPGAPVLATPTTSSTGIITLNWSATVRTTNYTLLINNQAYLAGLTNTSCVLSLPSGTYRFGVNATNMYNTTESNLVTVSIAIPPGAFTLTANSSQADLGTIDLSWTIPTLVSSYTIYQDNAVILSGTTVTSYQFLNVTQGTHTYFVQARNSYADRSSQVITILVNRLPTAVVLSADATSTTGVIVLSWNAATYVTNYTLYQNGVVIRTGMTNTTNLWQVSVNGQYQYTVTANNAVGSSTSNTITVTVKLTTTNPWTWLVIGILGGGGIAILVIYLVRRQHQLNPHITKSAHKPSIAHVAALSLDCQRNPKMCRR